ncbi:MAG: PIG-L family deacetylase [Acidimicrobiales bacterium]
MPTAVFVHPHPDDEAIFSGGAMRRAADRGWRVVLVLATSGEEGTMPDWVTVDAADHRRMETAEAAAHLGVDELHYLGYRDSGMAGSEANRSAGALAASIDDATADLAELLRTVGADAVVGQDPNGTYGHPDHVAVHRIGRDAAVRAGVGEVLEVTLDRAWLRELRRDRIERGRLDPAAWCAVELERLGTDDPAAPLVRLDVDAELAAKQAAMAAHASQVPDAADFMGIPPGTFHLVVRHEWYLRRLPADRPGPLERALLSPARGG